MVTDPSCLSLQPSRCLFSNIGDARDGATTWHHMQHHADRKAVYDKWHESELERWLSDNNIPHPSPSDRKNLQSTVKANWNDKVVSPYTSWDAQSLTNYLSLKGQQAKAGTEQDTKSLIEQVKGYWSETDESANQAYGSVKDWIFDSYVS
jgi:hypothetical protein